MAMTPDQLNDKDLAKYYGYAYELITSIPELYDLFTRASAGDSNWSKERFLLKLQSTKWWAENNAYARSAWAAQTAGGADWDDQIGAAKEAVRQRATALGFQIEPGELDKLARDYLYNGWGDGSRAGLLDQALSKYGDGKGGQFTNAEQSLRQLAVMNGIDYSDGWFVSAAKSVASGMSTVEEWEADIREQAASLFPVFGDKIRAGMNAYDLASPYITRMAGTLEIDPNEIKLNDQYLKQALGGMDEKGNPVAMNLWDFEKMLRQDERWQYTKQANDNVSNIAASVLRMFGFGG